MALVFPTATQAAAQTPINTFSPTTTPLVNTSNSITYVYDPVTGIWNVAGPGVANVATWSGGATGLTPATATAGAITLGGVLSVASGGTGATTQAAAAAAVLPPQAGNAGEFLTTDGTTTSWAVVATAPVIPAGARMSFFQASAPTGWTQVTTQNNVGVRIVSGAGGGTGGSIPFTTFFSSATSYSGVINITSGTVGDTTLSVAQLASHAHSYTAKAGQGGDGFGGNSTVDSGSTTGAAGGNAAHTHSLAGATANGNFTSNFALQYIDMILAAKD